MKRYPAYSNALLEGITEIPSHWIPIPLKYYAYMKGRIGWQGLKQSEFTDEGPYLITGMNFKNGNLNWDECYHITEERYNEAPEIHVKEKDVLITKDGTIGKLLFIDNLPGKASLNSHLLIIRPIDKKFLSKYLYYLLHSQYFLHHINYNKTGTTFYGLTQEAIGRFKAFSFDLKEQQHIINHLDHKIQLIDTLIEKKQKQLELLQEYRETIINHAVTKGLNPTIKMKDSGIEWLGKVPEHWTILNFKYIANIFRGKFSHRPRNDPALYDGPFPFIQTGDVAKSKKYITSYTQTLNENGFKVSKEFPKGTLVMTIAANIGDIAILDFNACFPDSIVGFYPNKIVNLDYLYYLLNVMKNEFCKVSTINTQLNINVDRISFCKCPIPPLKEQEEIFAHLDKITVKTDLLKSIHIRRIKYLQEYRTTLISEVVTGKIDVRDEAIP